MQYTKSRQFDAMDRALLNIYAENPHLLEEHRKRAVIESLLATAGTSGITQVAKSASPTGGRWPLFLPITVGLVAGGVSGFVGQGARRRNLLLEEGIDTNILGSYARPINEKGERYFR